MLLFEYAATLGMIDVAYVDPEGARTDFRRLWGVDELRFLSRYPNFAIPHIFLFTLSHLRG